jgi:tetratricopeptide (TPR) repeat protein
MKAKKLIGFLLVGAMALLMGCSGDGYTPELRAIDTIINEKPDSALRLLDSLSTEAASWPKSQRMRHSLLTMKAQNKADVIFTSDSIAKVLVDYFDSHGTTNEWMQAHYLLGRAYSDMGEAPRAISSYQDAIDVADTTATDFDFYTLSCVYSQMATVFYRQLLLTNEIEARKKASHYAFRANKPLWGIYNIDMIAGTYILMNKKDSAEIIMKSALEQYRKYGYNQQALRSSRALMHLYTDSPQRLDEAKHLMDQFEAESELFDKHHELPPSQRQYYYYKGMYYEGINKLDSAEFFYRKISRPEMSYVDQDPMYRGLLNVFIKRHQADSIAKYSQLFSIANDSSIAIKDQEIVAQMTATYNYNFLQKEAHESEVKAYKTLIGLIIIIVLLGILIIVTFLIWKSSQRKIERLKKELADNTDEYEENIRELRLLEHAHKEVITSIQRELEESQSMNSGYREKYAMAQLTISRLDQDYENERTRLLSENDGLRQRINELQQNDVISKHLSISASFAEEVIVKRIYEVANKPLITVTEIEWNELTKVFSNSYPSLYHDLSLYCNTPQNIRVCILTALGIGSGEQSNMLDTTKQRISNIKSTLNKALFNETSSRTLRRNLAVRYNIFV